MPDAIRVTRAVRRCETCGPAWGEAYTEYDDIVPCPDCSDGWVDVPLDEECPCMTTDPCPGCGLPNFEAGSGEKSCPCPRCPDCGGSGRRLHNWATGWYWGDTLLWEGRGPYQVDIVDLTNGNLLEQKATLVLSDPSHRPEPMRWKQ